MTPPGRVALLGLSLGLLHALDADHVVAVSAIVARTRGLAQALRTGALWGVGHGVTVLALGGAMVVAGLGLPPAAAPAVDLAVGATLLLLGVHGLRAERSREAPPAHRTHRREHLQGHEHARRQGLRALAVGLVHGLAGSAGLALLALSTVPGRALAAAYLGLFCAGTLAGMVALTVAVSLLLGWGEGRSAAVGRGLRLAVAIAGIAVGVVVGAEALLRPAAAGGHVALAREVAR